MRNPIVTNGEFTALQPLPLWDFLLVSPQGNTHIIIPQTVEAQCLKAVLHNGCHHKHNLQFGERARALVLLFSANFTDTLQCIRTLYAKSQFLLESTNPHSCAPTEQTNSVVMTIYT